MMRHPRSSPPFPSPPLSRSETETGPAPVGVRLTVGLEDVRQLTRGNPDARVFHLDLQLLPRGYQSHHHAPAPSGEADRVADEVRKSTRLNSSHLVISYAVFC